MRRSDESDDTDEPPPPYSLPAPLPNTNKNHVPEGLEESHREHLELLEAELGGDHAHSIQIATKLSAVLLAKGKFVETETLCRTTLERQTRLYVNPWRDPTPFAPFYLNID